MIPVRESPREPRPIEAARLRRVCARFATGVAVVTAGGARDSVGTTVNSFTSVSLEPPLVLFCLHRRSRLLPAVRESGGFVVNVLSARQEPLAWTFAGRDSASLDGVAHRRSAGGLPVLRGTLGFLACRLVREYDGGDHSIVLGEVVELGAPGRDEDPLVFFGGSMRALEEEFKGVPRSQMVRSRRGVRSAAAVIARRLFAALTLAGHVHTGTVPWTGDHTGAQR